MEAIKYVFTILGAGMLIGFFLFIKTPVISYKLH